jgi:hypothetical protein
MKNALDEILEHYENKEHTNTISTNNWSEADYELWEYLCGDGDVRHLYNYYDIQTLDNKTITI